MQPLAKIAIAAVAAAVFIPAVAGEIHFYGCAGGPVGAERIARIASYVSPRDLKEFDSGYERAGGPSAAAPASYGRAGGPIALAWASSGRLGGPVATGPAPTVKAEGKTAVAVTWFGRTGGPLPVGG